MWYIIITQRLYLLGVAVCMSILIRVALHFTHRERGKTFVNAYSKIRNLLFPLIFIIIFTFTSACSGSLAPSNPSSESPIEKNLRAFYNKLGGKDLLGDILSLFLVRTIFITSLQRR